MFIVRVVTEGIVVSHDHVRSIPFISFLFVCPRRLYIPLLFSRPDLLMISFRTLTRCITVAPDEMMIIPAYLIHSADVRCDIQIVLRERRWNYQLIEIGCGNSDRILIYHPSIRMVGENTLCCDWSPYCKFIYSFNIFCFQHEDLRERFDYSEDPWEGVEQNEP